MEGYGGPAASPTIAQCIRGSLGWLEVECNHCKTRASLPLDAIRRQRAVRTDASHGRPDSILAGVVDVPVVTDVSERYAGRVVAKIGTESPAYSEADFLKLGCQK